MSGQKVTQRAPKTLRAATSQTKPALELDDIDHLSRIELRLRYLADVLNPGRTFTRSCVPFGTIWSSSKKD